jgi:hypothetical protein
MRNPRVVDLPGILHPTPHRRSLKSAAQRQVFVPIGVGHVHVYRPGNEVFLSKKVLLPEERSAQAARVVRVELADVPLGHLQLDVAIIHGRTGQVNERTLGKTPGIRGFHDKIDCHAGDDGQPQPGTHQHLAGKGEDVTLQRDIDAHRKLSGTGVVTVTTPLGVGNVMKSPGQPSSVAL